MEQEIICLFQVCGIHADLFNQSVSQLIGLGEG